MNKPKHSGEGPSLKGELTARQELAILALVECPTIEDAAARVGVSRTSLWAWTKLETFRARLSSTREELFAEGLDAVKGSMRAAASTLVQLLSSRNENTRRLSASALLSIGIKARETLELEARIRRLEHIAEQNKARN